jgi:membrane protein
MKSIFTSIKNWIKRKGKRLAVFLRKVTLPGFHGQSLHEVGSLFIQGLFKGYVTDRAASVAFSFFTALFPMLLMLFTLIPYVPIENFQNDILHYLQTIIPLQIWNLLEGTITYIITHKSAGLLSVSFIFALLLATGGIASLYSAFNQTYHSYTTAINFLKQRWYALIILFAMFFLIVVLIAILGLGNKLITYLMQYDAIAFGFMYYLFQTVRIALAALLVVFAVALIYYFALPKPRKFHLFTPGSILCAFLMIATTLGFSLFISNFSHYNILYGSLGTILILTLYIYLNAIFILIGFEINRSIDVAEKQKPLAIKKEN